MVDTPRTVTELKAIFADGGNISAQDMRDLVESVVVPYEPGTLAKLQMGGETPPSPPANGASGVVRFDSTGNLDPDGWLEAGTYDSTNWQGQVFGARETIGLPPGLYLVSGAVQFTYATGDPTGAQLDLLAVDDRLASTLSGSYYAVGPSPVNTFAAYPYDGSFQVLTVEGEHLIPVPADHGPTFQFALTARIGGVTPTDWNGSLAIWKLA